MADLISVIVPVYNTAQVLPRCLDSILAQSYRNIEILAVDDGSVDGSGDVLVAYAGKYPNIRVIRQKNSGAAAARLRGLEEAAGEWIGFVDSDDEIEPEMYQRLLEAARKHQAQIAHCGYRMIFPDGRTRDFHNTGRIQIHNRTEALRELLSGRQVEPGLCSKLFHRQLFQGWEMDRRIRINEDLLMNFYLFSNAEICVFHDWCPYHYLVRDTSASRGALDPHRIYDPIAVKEIIRCRVPAELGEDAQRAYLNTCINVCHTLVPAGQPYRADLNQVRQLLKREQATFCLLGRKRRFLAWMIVHAPRAYQLVYRIYCRYFQKPIYS